MTKITSKNINKDLKNVKFVITGELSHLADEIEKKLKKNKNAYPFNKLIKCNVGNPLAYKNQKPFTYIREVLSILLNPKILKNINFNPDIVKMSHKYLKLFNIGQYSESNGFPSILQDVCNFIEKRDGYKCSSDNIIMTNGISEAMNIFFTAIRGNVVFLSVPTYALYSSYCQLFNIDIIKYGYQQEYQVVSIKELEEKNSNIKSDKSKIMVVVNPGNPSGQILTIKSMKEILLFCLKNKICLVADEVYQDNIYVNIEFISFRKLAKEMGIIDKGLQLVSFNSVSKGFTKEGGLRGGYMELLGFDDSTKKLIKKYASLYVCPNTVGQVALSLKLSPPKKGDASYLQYIKERNQSFNSYKRRGKMLVNGLNKIKNIKCPSIQSSLYVYPEIYFNNYIVNYAYSKGMHPDEFYCVELLQKTGILILPGNGFFERKNTYHLRLTILISEQEIREILKLMKEFNIHFFKKYKGESIKKTKKKRHIINQSYF